MNWWPTHGGANGLAPEMVFTCRGSIAIGTGWNDANAQYRGLQIGVGENHHPWVYMQCENIRPFNTNLTTSVPVLFNARYYSNGIPYMVGSGQSYSGWSKLPGMWGEATATNGNGAIFFFDAFDTYYPVGIPILTHAFRSWSAQAMTPAGSRFEAALPSTAPPA